MTANLALTILGACITGAAIMGVVVWLIDFSGWTGVDDDLDVGDD